MTMDGSIKLVKERKGKERERERDSKDRYR